MLSPRARAAMERAWAVAIAAEIVRRRDGPAAAAGEQLLDTLAAMAARLQAAARPGDREVTAEIHALARDRAFERLDAVRIKADLSPAEVVALMLAAGDADTACQLLSRYSRHPLTH